MDKIIINVHVEAGLYPEAYGTLTIEQLQMVMKIEFLESSELRRLADKLITTAMHIDAYNSELVKEA